METWYYEVVSIDGDYANLRRTDIPSEDLKLVARALLPAEIMEGSRLNTSLCSTRLWKARGARRKGEKYNQEPFHIQHVLTVEPVHELTGLIWAAALQ